VIHSASVSRRNRVNQLRPLRMNVIGFMTMTLRGARRRIVGVESDLAPSRRVVSRPPQERACAPGRGLVQEKPADLRPLRISTLMIDSRRTHTWRPTSIQPVVPSRISVADSDSVSGGTATWYSSPVVSVMNNGTAGA
jgi:hypothetical protein